MTQVGRISVAVPSLFETLQRQCPLGSIEENSGRNDSLLREDAIALALFGTNVVT